MVLVMIFVAVFVSAVDMELKQSCTEQERAEFLQE